MSQWGAARWARGEQCALAGNGSDPWSIVWTRAEQILFHYFTRVQLRDADNDKKIVSPDWRWNPLAINWGTQDRNSGSKPPVMLAGSSHSIQIQVQNTGIYAWDCHALPNRPIPFDYRLRYRWLNGTTVLFTGEGTSVCDLAPGSATQIDLTIQVPAGLSGTYTLQLDVHEGTEDFWFSTDGWPPYAVSIEIQAVPTPSPTPKNTPCPGC